MYRNYMVFSFNNAVDDKYLTDMFNRTKLGDFAYKISSEAGKFIVDVEFITTKDTETVLNDYAQLIFKLLDMNGTCEVSLIKSLENETFKGIRYISEEDNTYWSKKQN